MDDTAASDIPEEEDEEVQILSARNRCKQFFSSVSVEPLVFIYSTYISLAGPMMQQYVLARVSLDFNTTIADLNNFTSCTNNRSDPDYILKQDVQHATSSWWAVLNASTLPFAFFSTLFFGSYSDKGGRKLGMIVPVIGGVIKSVFCIVITALYLHKEWLFLAMNIEAVTGGYGAFFMSSFSYISDITDHENRAIRIVIVESALRVGVVVGQLVFGKLPSIGFFWSFVISAGIMFLALLYIFVIPESRIVTEKPKIFTTEHLKRLKEVYVTTDENGRRWKLLISVGILVFASMADNGRNDAGLLFVQNSPLCWNPTLIGYFGAISFVLSTLGSICLTKLLQHRVQDMVLILIGALSCMAQSLLQAFSTQTWMFFVGAVIGMFARLTTQLLRSFTSKVVRPDEQGAMYAVFAMIGITGALCGSVFFTTIYNITLEWMLGFVFIVAAIFCSVTVILASTAILVQRKLGVRYVVLSEEIVPQDVVA